MARSHFCVDTNSPLTSERDELVAAHINMSSKHENMSATLEELQSKHTRLTSEHDKLTDHHDNVRSQLAQVEIEYLMSINDN